MSRDPLTNFRTTSVINIVSKKRKTALVQNAIDI